MGPIYDEKGVEQGGVNSDHYYKIFGKEQLLVSQGSCLGVAMRDITISGIGQADDTVLLSNSLYSLQNLLHLSLNICMNQQVVLCVEKKKLQVLSTPNMKNDVDYMKLISPVNINGKKIDFFEDVEHVGVVRSTNGNLPNIITRITSHKKALAAVLFTGMARGHPAFT